MNDQEASLVDFLRVIKKRKTLIVGLTAVFTLAGAGYAVLCRPPDFTARGIIRIGQVAERQIESADTVVSAWSSLSRFLRSVEEAKLRYVPPGDTWRSEERLKRSVSLEVVKPVTAGLTADLVRISVTWRDPQDALALALALGMKIIDDHKSRFNSFLARKDEFRREMEDDLAKLTEMVVRMENSQRRLEEGAGIVTAEVMLLQANQEGILRLVSERRRELYLLRSALSEPLTFPTYFLQPPSPPVRPNPRRRTLITAAAFILGLTVSTIAAFAREYLELAR